MVLLHCCIAATKSEKQIFLTLAVAIFLVQIMGSAAVLRLTMTKGEGHPQSAPCGRLLLVPVCPDCCHCRSSVCHAAVVTVEKVCLR